MVVVTKTDRHTMVKSVEEKLREVRSILMTREGMVIINVHQDSNNKKHLKFVYFRMVTLL